MSTPIAGPAGVPESRAQQWAAEKGHPGVAQYVPDIWAVAQEGGIRPEVQLVQFCLETGWATSRVWRDNYNPAGIKGSGPYRKYGSPKEGFIAHRDLLKKYIANGRDTVEKMAARWAEDPNYSKKLLALLGELNKQSNGGSMGSVITRSQWGARSAKSVVRVSPSKRTEFILHHSTGSNLRRDDCHQWVREIQNFHMNSRGWADIGYNFLVCEHGDIFEGRGWDVIGAHAPNHNTQGIGCCYIGDGGETIPAASKKSIAELITQADARSGKTLKRLGHRDTKATACPGDQLYNWLKGGLTVTPVPPKPVPDSAPVVLVNLASHLVVDIAQSSKDPGAAATMFYCHGGPNQQFRLRFAGCPAGEFGLIAVHSGLALDVDGASSDSGAKIIQHPWHGGPNQRWKLKAIHPEVALIISAHSGKALDVPNGATTPGVQLQQWGVNDSLAQQFLGAWATP